MITSQQLRLARSKAKFIKKYGIKQCSIDYGVPMSNLTVCPKSHRYNGIDI